MNEILNTLFQMYLGGIVLGMVVLGVFTLISSSGKLPDTTKGKKSIAIPSLLILIWPLYVIWSVYYLIKKDK